MSMAIFNGIHGKSRLSARGTTGLKKLAGKITARFQGISNDRQQLWNAYNDISSTYSTSRCLWRRHGALLMYARLEKSGPNRALYKYDQ